MHERREGKDILCYSVQCLVHNQLSVNSELGYKSCVEEILIFGEEYEGTEGSEEAGILVEGESEA